MATDTPFTDAVIAQLNAEIGASEYSARSLAKKMGISYGVFLRYLTGERDIPLQVMFNAITALALDADQFIKRAQARAEQR